MGLTKQQQSVVDHRNGTLLVSAAAGSGKTKVLVERLLDMVCDANNPCNVDDFLIITYTNAAAAELRDKIADAVSERLAQQPDNAHLRRQLTRIYLAQISTVHAFCIKILKEYAYQLKIPSDFTIADDDTKAKLSDLAMKDCLKNLKVKSEEDCDAAALLRNFSFAKNDFALENTIKTFYEKSCCHTYPEIWRREVLTPETPEKDILTTKAGAYIFEEVKAVAKRLLKEAEDLRALVLQSLLICDKCLPCADADISFFQNVLTSDTWDSFIGACTDKFMRFPTIKDPAMAEEKDLYKVRRDRLKKEWGKVTDLAADTEEENLSDYRTLAPILRAFYACTQEYAENFSRRKLKKHLLDYHDVIRYTVRLLLQENSDVPTKVADEISERYREIMVDEYQDSNIVLDKIFDTISCHGKKLFMVGDVKQSIYRFQLADPSVFMEKYDRFSVRNNDGSDTPRKIVLTNNFRSAPPIIEAVNHVFRSCMSREVGSVDYTKSEELTTIRNFENIDEPSVELHLLDFEADAEEDVDKNCQREAQFIARRIHQLVTMRYSVHDKDGNLREIRYSDISVILRSVSPVLSEYISAFRAWGIPFSCDTDADFLISDEFRVLLSMLQTVLNPQRDIPLLAMMLSPFCGFTANEVAVLRAENKSGNIYSCLCESTSEKSKAFLSKLNDLREKSKYLCMSDFFAFLCDTFRIEELCGAMEESAERLKNIASLAGLIAEEEGKGVVSLSGLVRKLEMLDSGKKSKERPTVSDCVTIMTTHHSKGLEAEVVFYAGLSRKFNLRDLSAEHLLTDTDIGTGMKIYDVPDSVYRQTLPMRAIIHKQRQEAISEEMRVLYVGLTRAKSRLIMTYSANNLENHLQQIGASSKSPLDTSTSAAVINPGDWVLYAASLLPESVNIFGDVSAPRIAQEYPWKVCYYSPDVSFAPNDLNQAKNAEVLQEKTVYVPLQYDTSASKIPAKVTATQLKGRKLDLESAEEAAQTAKPLRRSERSRKITSLQTKLTPTERGTAMHRFLQFCRYENCTTLNNVEAEVLRLKEGEYLNEMQAESVDAEKITAFFTSELGKKILSSKDVQREFKFSVLISSERLYPECPGEEIMLQGVVDCFLTEPDGITVIDYKTDINCSEETKKHYIEQISIYAKALEEIFEMPVKEKILVFLQTGQCELVP